jgi:hypothetical protein
MKTDLSRQLVLGIHFVDFPLQDLVIAGRGDGHDGEGQLEPKVGRPGGLVGGRRRKLQE